MIRPFKSEPLVDFSKKENIDLMLEALEAFDKEKGASYPAVIGGREYMTDDKIVSVNPSRKSEIIGYAASSTPEMADLALDAAWKAFDDWKSRSYRERAYLLLKTAAIIRREKFRFSALLVEEVGKTFPEADAETAECIDFLEYYARQAIKLEKEGMEITYTETEINDTEYIPLGVGLAIAPWNFPLAIYTGMTAAGIVTGNTMIMKPASSAVVIGAKLFDAFVRAGAPAGVINFLPGSGGKLGNYIVSHPRTRFVNFTGSRDVGLGINRLAAEVHPGQKWIKRVSMELGGKNAIVVDSDCDLENAAAVIANSAFGYQGQKCSACSRAIIVSDVYDKMADLICEAAKKVTVGPSRTPGIGMGPVVDSNAFEKIRSYIRIGMEEADMVVGGVPEDSEGYYVNPVVFRNVPRNARIAKEEIFGPVLALIRADDFNDAIDIANDTDYGLTGSAFTNSREHLEKARRDFHVGNLYLNRKCTGALVGIQPFGGFNLSGTDSKAGGADYLLLFTQAKSMTEKL